MPSGVTDLRLASRRSTARALAGVKSSRGAVAAASRPLKIKDSSSDS